MGGFFGSNPSLLPAGVTQPEERSFDAAMEWGDVVDIPNFLEVYGLTPQDLEKLNELDMWPPPQDLDRIAKWARPAWSSAFAPPSWNAVLEQNKAPYLNRVAALKLWKQAHDLGALNEDAQGESPPGATRDWPDAGKNDERRIYVWSFDDVRDPHTRVRKAMQIQKFDQAKGEWRIFNQWGQDLTFEWKPDKQKWEAGFNLGDWLSQHASEVLTGIQIAFWALATAVSFGAAGPAGAAAAGVTSSLQQAAVKGMEGLRDGDVNKLLSAIKDMQQQAGKLADNPLFAKADLSPALKSFVESKGAKFLADAFGSAKSVALPDLVSRAHELFKSLGLSKDAFKQEIANVRAQLVPPWLRTWFDKGVSAGIQAPTFRGAIPWYGQPFYDVGAVYGSALAEVGQKGSRVMPTTPQVETTRYAPLSPALIQKMRGDDPLFARGRIFMEDAEAPVDDALFSRGRIFN
jgi:hypothetical protein